MTEMAFAKTYTIGSRIASGSRGVLYDCIHKTTGKMFACKIVNGDDNIYVNRDEERMVQSCKHENIINLHQVYFDYTNTYRPRKIMIYDRAEGDMFNYVIKDTTTLYTEDEAKIIIRQMLNAVNHLHSQNIIHRDIKLENFLYKKIDSEKPDTTDNINILLTDFEFAGFLDSDGFTTGKKGTEGYLAPEMIYDKYYTETVDIWAIGVCCHSILTKRSILKYPPSSKFIKGRYERYGINYDTEQWNVRSSQAKDFINSFLQQDPRNRWTIEEALKHEWLTC